MKRVGVLAYMGLSALILAGCERSSAVTSHDPGGKSAAVSDRGEVRSGSDGAGEGGAAARRDAPVRLVDGRPIWSPSRRGTAEENAQRSFERNGEAFAAHDLDAYVRKAHAFLGHPPAGTERLKRANGDELFYDAKDNIFAVAGRDGSPRAMFKPDQGAAYWEEQKDRETKRQTARSDHRGRNTSDSDG